MKCSFIKSCLLCLLSLIYFSCTNSDPKSVGETSRLSKIKIGMNYLDVVEIAGLPEEKINVGIATDEFGLQTKTEEWHYGENELIVIVNDTVNAIDLDVKSTYQKIQHIIDSAKAAGDTSVMIQQIQ